MVSQELQQDEEAGGGFNWTYWLPIIIAGVIFWLIFRGNLLCITNPEGILIMPPTCYYTWMVYTAFIGLGMSVLRFSIIGLKYMSPHFIGNNIHGSITGRAPVVMGTFCAKRLGGIDFGLIKEGNECTVLYPIEAHNQLGSQMGAACRFEKRSLSQIPFTQRQALIAGSFPHPYWYGDIDESQFRLVMDAMIDDMTDAELKELSKRFGDFRKMNPAQLRTILKEESELCNKFEKERARLMGSADEIIDFATRVSEKAGRKRGILNRIRRKREEEI